MNHWRKLPLTIAALVMLNAAARGATTTDTALDSRWAEHFHRAIGDRAVGYAFAVMRAGRLVASGAEGYARAPWERTNPALPMTPQTRMYLASIGKAITAVALLDLMEEKGFSLDEPFWPYLQSRFANLTPGAGVERVTMRQLLGHRSGLIGWEAAGAGDKTRALLMSPLKNEPGTKYQYNNGNFIFARLLVQQIAQQDYVERVQQRVLRPMGLKDMGCVADATSPTLYYKKGDTGAPGWLWPKPGQWCGSAVELAQFLASVRAHLPLSPATTEMMFRDKLGWHQRRGSRGTYYHKDGGQSNGAGQGFVGDIAHLADETDAVLLINSPGFPALDLIIEAYERGFSQ